MAYKPVLQLSIRTIALIVSRGRNKTVKVLHIRYHRSVLSKCVSVQLPRNQHSSEPERSRAIGVLPRKERINVTIAQSEEWQLNAGWPHSCHNITKELFCHLFPCKSIATTGQLQVPRARSVRRHAVTATNNSFTKTFVLHSFVLRCLLLFNAFKISLLICISKKFPPAPIQYEHFIYIML
jgi:hypothetical protein